MSDRFAEASCLLPLAPCPVPTPISFASKPHRQVNCPNRSVLNNYRLEKNLQIIMRRHMISPFTLHTQLCVTEIPETCPNPSKRLIARTHTHTSHNLNLRISGPFTQYSLHAIWGLGKTVSARYYLGRAGPGDLSHWPSHPQPILVQSQVRLSHVKQSKPRSKLPSPTEYRE